ncbi:MAG TPA: class I SAM-dependent methyltransferase [Ktedonobacterales bacterium]
MPHRFDARQRFRLLSEEREAALQPEFLLRDLGFTEGMTLADIGCGPGFFSIPAARITGETGVVFAADIEGEMLSTTRSRATEAGLTNVRIVKTNDREIPIPPDSCDFVLMAFMIHEIEHRASFLHRAARLLKPEGKLVVLEWEKVEETVGPPLEERLAPEDVVADAEAAGLRPVEERSVTHDQYLRVFQRALRRAAKASASED